MDKILEKKDTIVAVLIVLVVLLGSWVLTNFLKEKKNVAQENMQIIKFEHDNLKSGVTSEKILSEKLSKLDNEVLELKKEFVKDLRIQDVNISVMEIAKNTGLFSENSYNIYETVSDIKGVKKIYTVNINDAYSNYENIKKFLEYVENYDKRITVESLDLEKEELTNNFKGDIVLKFYSM